jgi:hypothetical protein
MNAHSGNGAGRKPGEWKTVANSRSRIERTPRTTRGLTNVPSMTDVGSAAYRRLKAKADRKFGRAA